MKQTQIKNFEQAREFLGAKRERPYAHNTRIEMTGPDEISAKYHGNTVVTFLADGTNVYDSCGWRTITTKERINWFLPDGFTLWQERSIWFISDRSQGWENAKRYTFADGITINESGEVSNAGPEDEQEQVKKQIKRIKSFVDGFIKALLNGDVPAPSGGDCWYCLMTTEDGKSLGDAVKNSDHIESHIDESYYVPSLLTRAYEFNHRMSMLTRDGIARLFQGESIGEWQQDIVSRDVRSSLTAYLKHQLGLAQ